MAGEDLAEDDLDLLTPPPAPAGDSAPASTPATPWTSSRSAPAMLDTAPLADIQRRKTAATTRVQEDTSGRLERDRQRVEGAFQATGIQPGELPAWDAGAMGEKFRTDPLEAFGSMGSVFAMVASAFTRAPMENALNAGAAAMNAVRQGDEQNFNRAYEAWKANNQLAIQRHNIQQQSYQNAITMMTTNMTAGRAQMEMLATRFGDERTQFLLDNGLDQQAIQLQASRADAMKHIQDADTDITQANLRRQMWEQEARQIDQAGVDPATANSRKMVAFNRIYGRSGTPQQEAFGMLLREMPGATAEQITQRAQQLGLMPRASGAGVVTRDRRGALESQALQEEYMRSREEGGLGLDRNAAFARAERVVAAQQARMTGNQLNQQGGRIQQFNSAINRIDSIMSVLDNHIGATGLPGRARRLGERISNLAGGGNTDMVQMMRDIELLKSEAPQLLLNRSGRPLSAEAGHLNNFIAGLNVGDTTANTRRAMVELRALFEEYLSGQQQRLDPAVPAIGSVPGSSGAPAGGGARPAPAAKAPVRAPAWTDDPVIQ